MTLSDSGQYSSGYFHSQYRKLIPRLDAEFGPALEQLSECSRRAKLTCALSGGPDSVLAVLLAFRAAEQAGGPLPAVFHLDHALRRESYADRNFCGSLARAFGAEFVSFRIHPGRCIIPGEDSAWQRLFQPNQKNEDLKTPIPAKLTQTGGSLEERARLWRRFLIELIRPQRGYVVTGHNLTDWYEGFFLRLDRGGGPAVALTPAHVITPLGDRSKREIISHLDAYEFPYRVDPSNSGLEFRRNQFRLAAGTENLEPKGIRQSRKHYQEHQREVDDLLYNAFDTYDRKFCPAWPTFDADMPTLGLRTWLADRAMRLTGKVTALRAELPLAPLSGFDGSVRKYVIDSILAAWALPPLAGGLWAELREVLSLRQHPGRPSDGPGASRRIWTNRFVSFGDGGRGAQAYLVIRPNSPLWWTTTGSVIGPALPPGPMPGLGSLTGDGIGYEKSLVVKVGGKSKKIGNYLQELGVSRLDRPFIRLLAGETPGAVRVGLNHIRPLWPDSGE